MWGVLPFLRERRWLLRGLLSAGVATALPLPLLIRQAFSMGFTTPPQGIYTLEGDVRINGRPAAKGDPVVLGDVITTGPDAMAIFIIDKSVYLVRGDSRVDLAGPDAEGYKKDIKTIIRMMKGKMLTVFGRGRRRIHTPTAVIGVRGTGVYVESEQDSVYVCTCYGKTRIVLADNPSIGEDISTNYHESPRYVYPEGNGNPIAEAPVINHTDAELILLESLVWRQPPFVDEQGNGGNGGGGY
jgi:hypothetical protein